jgi:hypothetical protein
MVMISASVQWFLQKAYGLCACGRATRTGQLWAVGGWLRAVDM